MQADKEIELKMLANHLAQRVQVQDRSEVERIYPRFSELLQEWRDEGVNSEG